MTNKSKPAVSAMSDDEFDSRFPNEKAAIDWFIRKSGLISLSDWQLIVKIVGAAIQRHGIVPRRTCVLDSKGQERKAFLINIPLCGMLLAPAQIRHDLQRSGIKPDGIINFLSNEPPIEQGVA